MNLHYYNKNSFDQDFCRTSLFINTDSVYFILYNIKLVLVLILHKEILPDIRHHSVPITNTGHGNYMSHTAFPPCL